MNGGIRYAGQSRFDIVIVQRGSNSRFADQTGSLTKEHADDQSMGRTISSGN
jgi:hypothetical protein